MADRPPWLDYQAPQGVTVPLGPPDPYKQASEARAERADQRAAAAEARAQKKFEQEDTMAPPPGDTSKTGEEYLATIPPTLAGQVRALAEGRRAFPTGSALRSPAVQQLIAAATQFDPTLDAANAATRVKTRSDFTSGKSAQNITAINTALGHFGTLWQAAQGLENRQIPAWNAVANAAETASGDPRVNKFNIARNAVVNELERVFRGTGGSEADIQQWRSTINSSMSPEQLRESVAQGIDLLNSRLQALGAQYNQGMNGSSDPITLLNPHSQEVFNALAYGGNGILPDNKGGPSVPPSIGGGGKPPSGGLPGDAPKADYSGMVGGPNQGVATGAYRNVYDPVMASAISAFIRRGTDYGTAAAYAQSHGFNPPSPKEYAAAVSFQKQHPNATPNVQADRSVPTTLGERLSASPLAAGIVAAGRGATAGLDDVVGRTLAGDQYDANSAALSALNPKADLAGNIAGGVLGMYYGGGLASKALNRYAPNVAKFLAANPVKAAAAGDALYGATYGASENPDNPLLGAGVGLATAPVASLAGQGATKALGATVRGVVDPAVQRLQAAGIPLTVGEALGGGWKKAQDAMTATFGPGDMVGRRYAEGRRLLNETAFNNAGDVVGTPINATGQEGIDRLAAAKSRAYSNSLDPVQLNLNDPQFIQSMEGALSAADAIPGAELPEGYGGVSIRHYVGNQIAPDGTMTGKGFQSAYRGLAQTANKAAPKIEGHDIGQAVGQAKDALITALKEQNPGAFEGFQKANTANRYLNVLADAVNAAKNQIGDEGEPLFTPAQLGTAATANAKKYGSAVSAASGDRPFNQLINDAQKVMSSKLPESGTAPRRLMQSLVLGGGLSAPGAALGYGSNGTEGAVEGAAVPLTALTLLGTRRGQQLLTAALLKRTAPFRIAGQALIDNPQAGGNLLTATTFPFLASQ